MTILFSAEVLPNVESRQFISWLVTVLVFSFKFNVYIIKISRSLYKADQLTDFYDWSTWKYCSSYSQVFYKNVFYVVTELALKKLRATFELKKHW